MGIREERQKKNITQKKIAEVLGVNATVVSKYEKGIVTPPADKIKRIADFLGVTVDRLMTEDYSDGKSLYNVHRMTNPYSDDLDKYAYQRNNDLEKKVLVCAKGYCELCGNKAPFCTADGTPYLETHYVRWLSEGGLPIIENIVALCPNCHRKVHVIQSSEDIDFLVEVAAKHGNMD